MKAGNHRWVPVGRLKGLVSSDEECLYCGLIRTEVANERGWGRHWEFWSVLEFGGIPRKELREYRPPCPGNTDYYATWKTHQKSGT